MFLLKRRVCNADGHRTPMFKTRLKETKNPEKKISAGGKVKVREAQRGIPWKKNNARRRRVTAGIMNTKSSRRQKQDTPCFEQRETMREEGQRETESEGITEFGERWLE